MDIDLDVNPDDRSGTESFCDVYDSDAIKPDNTWKGDTTFTDLASKTRQAMLDSLAGQKGYHGQSFVTSEFVKYAIEDACEWFRRQHGAHASPKVVLETQYKMHEFGPGNTNWYKSPLNVHFNLYLLNFPAAAVRILSIVWALFGIDDAIFSDKSSLAQLADEGSDVFEYLLGYKTSNAWKDSLKNKEQDFMTRRPTRMANRMKLFEIGDVVEDFRKVVGREGFWEDFRERTEGSEMYFEREDLMEMVKYKERLLDVAMEGLREAFEVGGGGGALGMYSVGQAGGVVEERERRCSRCEEGDGVKALEKVIKDAISKTEKKRMKNALTLENVREVVEDTIYDATSDIVYTHDLNAMKTEILTKVEELINGLKVNNAVNF